MSHKILAAILLILSISSCSNCCKNTAFKDKMVEAMVTERAVFFTFNSHDLSSENKEVLDKQVSWLKSNSDSKVVIQGHCDNRGTKIYNYALGKKRANVVKNYLVHNGIAASRIDVVSYGKDLPAVSGFGEEVWSKNRRAITISQSQN